MTNTPLKFAIIGSGLIGRKRAAVLKPGQLRYVCDVDPVRATELANVHPGAVAITDYRKALADPLVNGVIVATLHAALAPITTDAVNAGKHVLVEKPGALNAGLLRQVKSAAEQSKVAVRLAYNHRFHPGLLKAHELVSSGVLGPMMFLRGRYGHGGRIGYDREWRADPKLSGGGELMDQGVHLIDLASWFLGEFTSVSGHAATYFWDMRVDDNAFMSLRTAGGQMAWLHVSCTEWKNLFSLELYGRDGKIAIDGLGGSYGVERCTYYKMLPQMGPPEIQTWDYPQGDGSWALELAAFENDIRSGLASNPSLAEGIRTLDIVEQIYRSSGYPIADGSNLSTP